MAKMAGRKPIDDGEMSENDIEFFRRELKSTDPTIVTLITGTRDEAQKVLRDMIDAGANFQDEKLSEKHESVVDANKMRIEQTIRIEESLSQGSAMPGMTLRAKRGHMRRQIVERIHPIDLRIGDDMEEKDCSREVKRAIDTSDLKKHIDETFQESDFSVKEFHTDNYPKNSQAYLKEAGFYCRKAREYRAKGQTATAEADWYAERSADAEGNILEQYMHVSAKYREVGKGYLEVFYYCIQEAVYWKLKAEIYLSSDKDKKRIQNPSNSSSCKIHSENDVTKFLYVPTDKRNIDETKIDLELTKVGLGSRNGVDNVMLIVKELEECKDLDTLDMVERLSFYGGNFKDRGMVMVTEEKKLIDDVDPNEEAVTEEKYFINEARSDDYSDIFKILAKENRFITFDKKEIDPYESKKGTETGEILKQGGEDTRCSDNFHKIDISAKSVRRVTEGVRYQSSLTQTGMGLFRDLNTASQGVEAQFDRKYIDQAVQDQVFQARGHVNKLRIEEGRYVAEKQREELGRRQEIVLGKQRKEQEERRRKLEIEMEQRRKEQEERDRKRELERERERQAEKIERYRKLFEEIESKAEVLKRIQRNGEEQLRDVKRWLDNCEKKDDPKYLEVKKEYERLKAFKRIPFYDDDPEKYLEKINTAICNEELWNYNVRSLVREKDEVEKFIERLIEELRLDKIKVRRSNEVKERPGDDIEECALGGAAVGAGFGVLAGGVAGTVAGPIGTVIAGAVGGVVGGAVGGVVGGAVGVTKKIWRLFW